jgi:hypothetical protein
MAGSFTNSFTPAGSSVTLTSAGGSDIFVAKYTRSGAFLWATSMGGAGHDSGKGIAVDATGNVFVSGRYSGAATFGSTTLNSPGGSHAFAAKPDANGKVLWAKNGLTIGRPLADSPDVAVDGAGNAYVAVGVQPVGGIDEVVVFKLDGGSGATQWTDPLVGQPNRKVLGLSESPRLAVTGSNVYVTGSFAGTVDFDPGSGTYTLTSSGNEGGFVLKLTNGGAFVWADGFVGVKSGSSYGACYPSGIGVDGAGNVYTTGWFSGTVNFDPHGTFVLNSGASFASFVTKLNAAGNLVWAKQFATGTSSSSLETAVHSLAVDGTGAVYLTGSFTGTTSFNPAGGGSLTSAGSYDIFVSKLDTNGTFQWAVSAGGSGYDSGNGIAVDGFGDIYIAGSIAAGTATFGDPSHSLTTATATSVLWQITQP